MTKMGGDARGGAALSPKQTVGKPIRYVGTGEKLSDLELFHPDRMASRMLGMGDIVSLVERAQDSLDQEEAEAAAAKLAKGQFTLEDFAGQLRQVKKMGPLENVIGMLPGAGKLQDMAVTVRTRTGVRHHQS